MAASSRKSLETVKIPGVEIFAVGVHNKDTFSEDDLQAMVQALPQTGFKPPVKAGHADGQEQEEEARKVFGAPALGYVERLYVKGKKLIADLVDVPKKFAELIKAGAYKRISSEIFFDWKDSNLDLELPHVLKSIAFLGTEIPALTNLDEIRALYDNQHNEYRVYNFDLGMADYLTSYPRKTKEESGYEESVEGDERCSTCRFWVPGYNSCTIVEGFIVPGGISDFYEPFPVVESVFSDGTDTHEYTVKKRGNKWLLISDTGKVLGTHDSKAKAEAQEKAIQANKSRKNEKEIEGGKDMDQKEFETKLATLEEEKKVKETSLKELEAKMAKEKKTFEEMQAKASDETKARLEADAVREAAAKAQLEKAEKEKGQLEVRLQKLETQRKAESIENYLRAVKAEGKLVPAQEPTIRALLYALPEDGERTVTYSKDDKEVKQSPLEAIKGYINSMPKLFQVMSRNGDGDLEPEAELSDPGAEVDRRAKEYQEKHDKTDYVVAVKAVLNADKALAIRWNNMEKN